MAGGFYAPLSQWKAWPHHNWVNPEKRGWGLSILVIILSVLTISVVCARLWARMRLQRNAGVDDVLITIAVIPMLGLDVSTILGSRIYGLGLHLYDQTPVTALQSPKISLVIEIFYIFCTGLTKISILCLYQRLAPHKVAQSFIYKTWACIAFIIAYVITFLFVRSFGCKPISAFWYRQIPQWRATHEFSCLDDAAVYFTAGSISVVQDILAVILPMILVWKLQMTRRQKIAVGIIFSLGIVTCITCAMRLIYLHRILYTTYDISWESESAWVWTAVEVHLGMICASAPALRFFFGRFFEKSRSRSPSSTSRRSTITDIGSMLKSMLRPSVSSRTTASSNATVPVSEALGFKEMSGWSSEVLGSRDTCVSNTVVDDSDEQISPALTPGERSINVQRTFNVV